MTNSEQLPSDVVAVESNGRGYLFYVNNKNQLAYLLGPQQGKDFQVVVMKDAVKKPFNVNPDVKQIAAIAWVNKNGDREVRVYFSSKENGWLSEVYSTNEGVWTEGALHEGNNKFSVLAGSSISATVTRNYDSKPNGIKVYAADAGGKVNKDGIPNMSVFKTQFGEEWEDPIIITSKVSSY